MIYQNKYTNSGSQAQGKSWKLLILWRYIFFRKSPKILQITENHLYQYLKLLLIHRDPFDRLIYSQAKAEKLTFLFTDEIFRQYENLS